MRVAILEDHMMLRELYARVFQHPEFQLISNTGSPEQFMREVDACTHDPANPGVAFVDLSIRSVEGVELEDGISVIRRLLVQREDLWPVVVSGAQDPKAVARAASAGARGFIRKATTGISDLQAVARAVARGERVFPFTPPEPTSPDSPHHPLRSLTSREREVLSLVAGGADNLKIAVSLDISERTVKAHLTEIYRKMSCENRAQLALLARDLGVWPRQ